MMGKRHGVEGDSKASWVHLAAWTRARACSAGTCVEARLVGEKGMAQLRDSKLDELGDRRPIIELSTERFLVFQDELLGLAPVGANGEIAVDQLDGGWVAFRSLSTGVVLRFDADEMSAFVEGVRLGEFRPALATA